MSRTPIPNSLIHQPAEVEENGKLFDELVSLLEVVIVFDDGGFVLDRETREVTASTLLEKIRQKVSKEREVRLPFGLVIKTAD